MESSTQTYNHRFEVFSIAFALLFLESIFFKTALYIHDYINALMVISYALLGLGIGSILSSFFHELKAKNIFLLKLTMFICVILSFINFVVFPSYIFFSPFLVLPFIAGNSLISYFLQKKNSHTIYFVDLTGATLGVLSSVVLIPWMREENCFILILTLLAVSMLFNQSKGIKFVSTSLVLFSLGLLVFNIYSDQINFAKITKCDSGINPNKIFCSSQEIDLMFSKSSNVQRIEAYQVKPQFQKGYMDKMETYVAFDGLTNDRISQWSFPDPYDEPRLINRLVENPKLLIIGTAAEGVIKTAKSLGGHLTGLEINNQIINLMQGPMYQFSNKAYDLIDTLHPIDARTFIKSTESKYDFITLLNTHIVRSASHIGSPEYLHTKEAISSYLNLLTEKGTLVFEERIYNEQTRLSVIKLLHTIVHVMKNHGIQNPEKHLLIYRWNCLSCTQRLGSKFFVMIYVKAKPYTLDDWENIKWWNIGIDKDHHEMIELFPAKKEDSSFANQIHSVMENRQIDQNQTSDLSIITDEKPYPWSVFKDNKGLERYLVKISIVCLVILVCLLGFWKIREKQLIDRKFILFSCYFALIGLGYFIIETGLMHFYQIYTGSPTNTFIFILATLLFASGLGSYFSKNYSSKKALYVFLGILILSVYHYFINKNLIPLMGARPIWNCVMIGFTVFPLGFLMGIPFPYGLEGVKKEFSGSPVAFFFALNCVFSTFAVFFSFYFSVNYGFSITFGSGITCYFLSMVLLYFSRLNG